MTHGSENTRHFRVYACHLDRHHGRVVEETSFEAAAIAYLECFELSAPTDSDGEFRVVVHDVRTGHERCFTLDLDTADAAPCG